MRKTDKKIENNIRIALTHICEEALKEISGFAWLTHTVNYDAFPKSLKITCIFINNETQSNFLSSNNQQTLIKKIQKALRNIHVNITAKNITFDNEESCMLHDEGNWQKRLNKTLH